MPGAGALGDPAAAVVPAFPEEDDGQHVTVSNQILSFLLGIKALKREGVQNRRDFEQALYAKRFDLLFSAESTLPQFHALPQQALLKDFLLSGKVQGGHQSVAHVLYPDTVTWPEEETGPDAPGSVATMEPRWSLHHGSSMESELEEEADEDEQEEKVEVMLCGRKVHQTLRGRALKDLPREIALVKNQEIQALPEARFKQATAQRRKLERELRLEAYQERRIAERIGALEQALEDEVEYREELQKRQKKRETRQKQLKKDLELGVLRKLEAERHDEELEKQKKEEARKEKQCQERHQKALKEKVEKWQAEVGEPDPHRRAQKRRQEQEKEALLEAMAVEEYKAQHAPLKRLEVEAKLEENELCLEERPFRAPVAALRPRPILQMLQEPPEPPPPRTWQREAQSVSRRYGLNARNLKSIEATLARKVKPDAKGSAKAPAPAEVPA